MAEATAVNQQQVQAAVPFTPALLQAMDFNADALADGLSRLGFRTVTMRGEGEIVPRGYFKINEMFRAGSDTYNSRPDTKKPKDVKPYEFIRSKQAQNQIALIAESIKGSPATHVYMTFPDGSYKGTWVHPELAILAAAYLDKATAENGQLGVIMARALMIVTSDKAMRLPAGVEETLGHISGAIVGLHQDMQVQRDMFHQDIKTQGDMFCTEINKRPKVAQVDKAVIMAMRNESHAALAQHSKAMQDMSAEQRSMKEQTAKSREELAEQLGKQTAELVGHMQQSAIATLAPSQGKKRPFTMVEAAKEAMPEDSPSAIHLLRKTGQLAMDCTFQSMMEIIPNEMGIKPIGETPADGDSTKMEATYHAELKPVIVKRICQALAFFNM